MAEYSPSSIKDKVKVHKIAKKGTRLISSHLDWTLDWSMKDLLMTVNL